MVEAQVVSQPARLFERGHEASDYPLAERPGIGRTASRSSPGKHDRVLEVVAPDRPGLLAVVGQVFFNHSLRLHSAKISTLGERVEDVFFLTDRTDQIIEESARIEQIQSDLRDALDENTQQAS